jgi:hypothetical protein
MASIAPPRPAPTPARRSARLDPSVPARLVAHIPSLDALLGGFFALLGWGVGIARLSDNSLFLHLRTGQLILDQGIPHADPYSYTAAGTEWIGQSWLAQTLYGSLLRTTGAFGVRVLGGVVGAFVAVMLFRLALRLTFERVRAALLTLVALGGFFVLWSIRPLALGALALVVLVWIVELPDSWLGRRPVVALPVLFWLWANVHGSFALGFAYLGLHLIGRWIDGARPWADRERTWLVGAAIAFVAIFVNPFGTSLVTFPVKLLGRGDILRDVVEWSSPDFHTVRGLVYALWVAVFVFVVARGARRVTWRDLVVTVPFLLLGFWALRNITIAPIVGLPVAARAVAVRRIDAASDAPTRRRVGVLNASAAGVLIVFLAAVGLRAAGEPDFRVGAQPVAAMESVERQGLLGRNLLTDDSDAGYVLLRYWPRQPVFMDDRFDMYPRAVIHDFMTVSNGEPGWDRVLRDRDVEVVVWERDRALSALLARSGDWRVMHTDAHYVVFVLSDLV